MGRLSAGFKVTPDDIKLPETQDELIERLRREHDATRLAEEAARARLYTALAEQASACEQMPSIEKGA